MNFWWTVVAVLLAMGVSLGVTLLALPMLTRRMVALGAQMVMDNMTRTGYLRSMFTGLNVLRKIDPQIIVETMMRSAQGKPLSRPMGTYRQLSPWQDLLLQPVYLKPRLPTPHDVDIDTRTVIGPKAGRPLQLEIPLLVAGMSYGGALDTKAKVALARAATAVGTATNSGEGYVEEERTAAGRFILQYHRGLWPRSPQNEPSLIERCDALEIQLGQGAQAAASMKTPAGSVNEKMRDVFGLDPGEPMRIGTRLRGVDSPQAFVQLVRELRGRTDAPIGVKIGAGQTLEQDFEVFCAAGVDFIAVDGAEGGTHGGPPILQDDVGLPTLYALARADDYLRVQGMRSSVSLIAAGGMTAPGIFMKAMALGADAVYLGTILLIAMIADQGSVAVQRGYPPSDLFLAGGPATIRKRLSIDSSTENVTRYLQSCVQEMQYVAQSLGKTSLRSIDRSDLVALRPDLAQALSLATPWPSRASAEPSQPEREVPAEPRPTVH